MVVKDTRDIINSKEEASINFTSIKEFEQVRVMDFKLAIQLVPSLWFI